MNNNKITIAELDKEMNDRIIRNEYKEVYAQNMMRVCQDIIREEYEVLNPVWRNYFSLCVKYKCGLETK